MKERKTSGHRHQQITRATHLFAIAQRRAGRWNAFLIAFIGDFLRNASKTHVINSRAKGGKGGKRTVVRWREGTKRAQKED